MFGQRLSLVSIGVGLECAGIDDSFVVHQAIPFVLGLSEQGVVFRVPDNVVAFGDLNLSGFEEGCLDFVFDILTHDFIIELGVAFTVESEPSHLAFDMSLIGLIAVVFGARTHKFVNVFIVTQFGVEFPQTGAQVRFELSGCFLQVDDGVGVKV